MSMQGVRFVVLLVCVQCVLVAADCKTPGREPTTVSTTAPLCLTSVKRENENCAWYNENSCCLPAEVSYFNTGDLDQDCSDPPRSCKEKIVIECAIFLTCEGGVVVWSGVFPSIFHVGDSRE